MRDTELQSRLQIIGMTPAKAREVTRMIRDELHPTAAVAATMVRRADSAGLSGLGKIDAARSGSMIASGAKIGSVVPGIGTAIGAAVGALASLVGINKGTKPQRRARGQQVLSELARLPPDYQGRQVEYGQKSEPTSGFILLIQAVHYAGWQPDWRDIWTNNPGNMNRFSELIIENAKTAARAVVNAPVNAPLSIKLNTYMDNMRSREMSFNFINPGYQSPQQFAQMVIGPIVAAMLGNMKTRNQGGPAAAAFPQFQTVAALLADKVYSEVAPASISTQVAQAPVANVPAPIVQDALNIANQITQANITPTVVAPVVPTVASPNMGIPVTPIPLAPTTGFSAANTNLPPAQDMTAGILQTLLSTAGQANMVSPEARQIVADVAAQGVQQTPQGPSKLPAWVVPASIGAGALLLGVMFLKRK
jgi:hypothetical protein